MSRVNKYPGICHYCNARVAANAGNIFRHDGKWAVTHLACAEAKGPEIIEYYSPATGFYGTRNARGRCEDAPCCGCCTM